MTCLAAKLPIRRLVSAKVEREQYTKPWQSERAVISMLASSGLRAVRGRSVCGKLMGWNGGVNSI